jgi:hypothetical protein
MFVLSPSAMANTGMPPLFLSSNAPNLVTEMVIESTIVSQPAMLPTKPSRKPLVELKNGKVIFKQKALGLEKLSETILGTCWNPHIYVLYNFLNVSR